MNKEELLFDELHEKTKDCGRVQFVKLLMTKERENKELKEKLDKYENPEDMTLCRDIASGHRKEFQDRETILLNQQKEFIKYLEDEIKRINPNDLDIGELNLRLDDIKFIQYLIYKEILQKYKEIIGVSDENSKN